MSAFTEAQRAQLLAPIQPFRVQELDGISHLAAWDVIAHLNRLFGFEGWDKEILSLEPVYEHVGQREVGHRQGCRRQDCNCRTRSVPACSVGYRCTMRLTVRNPDGEVVRVIEDAAMGTATNQRDLGDAHDLATKSAVSYALKRCAKDLGDQFGLSLYNKGQETACVQHVFPYDGAGDFKVNVEADGIAEGDDSFGDKRGDRTEQHDPVPGDGEGIGSEPEPEPVREPEPARRQPAPKPEPTPPPERTEAPQVSEEQATAFADLIGKAETVDDLRAVWQEIANAQALDALVLDVATEKQMALREVLVRRVNQIETGQAGGDAA